MQIGVYSTSQAAKDAFSFYSSDAELSPSNVKSTGIGNAFVGTLTLGGTYEGTVWVGGYEGTTYIGGAHRLVRFRRHQQHHGDHDHADPRPDHCPLIPAPCSRPPSPDSARMAGLVTGGDGRPRHLDGGVGRLPDRERRRARTVADSEIG